MDDLDTLKINKFDLLSAYIDNEVSLAERKQVEDWLRSDPDSLQLYQQLLQVQRSCRAIPTPTSTVPVEQTVEEVMARIDVRRRRLPLWGALGMTAVVLGGITGLVTGGWNVQPQIARTPINTIAEGPIRLPVLQPPPSVENPSDSVAKIPGHPLSVSGKEQQPEPTELLIEIDQPLVPGGAHPHSGQVTRESAATTNAP